MAEITDEHPQIYKITKVQPIDQDKRSEDQVGCIAGLGVGYTDSNDDIDSSVSMGTSHDPETPAIDEEFPGDEGKVAAT